MKGCVGLRRALPASSCSRRDEAPAQAACAVPVPGNPSGLQVGSAQLRALPSLPGFLDADAVAWGQDLCSEVGRSEVKPPPLLTPSDTLYIPGEG